MSKSFSDNFLTAGRQAVWRSIKEYECLQGQGVQGTIWKRVFLWNDKSTRLIRRDENFPPPAAVQPAISIFTSPAGHREEWHDSIVKLLRHKIDIEIWTPGHDMDGPCDLWEKIWRAIHQVPSASNPYLKQVTGVLPTEIDAPEFESTTTDTQIEYIESGEGRQIIRTSGIPCMITRFSIIAQHRKNPRDTFVS